MFEFNNIPPNLSLEEELLLNYTRTRMLTDERIAYYGGFGYDINNDNKIVLKIVLDSEVKRGKILIPDGFAVLDPKAFMFFESSSKKLKEINLGNISVLESFSLSCLYVKNIYGPNVKQIDSFVFDSCPILESIYLPSLEKFRYDSFDFTDLKNLKTIQLGSYTLNGLDNIRDFIEHRKSISMKNQSYTIIL